MDAVLGASLGRWLAMFEAAGVRCCVLLAASPEAVLHPSLDRLVDEVVDVGMPDDAARRLILAHHLALNGIRDGDVSRGVGGPGIVQRRWVGGE